jgi:CRISPR-associated protein (TIGR03986 family)
MAKGTIKRIFEDKGYGFIQPDERGEDVWFHASKVKGEISFAQFNVGLPVEYETEAGRRGGVQAKFVHATVSTLESANALRPASLYRFLNPYNFVRSVPQSEKKENARPMTGFGAVLGNALGQEAVKPRAMTEAQLLGRCAPPPHDRYVGLTGKVTCTLKTITPLFISDPDYKPQGEHKSFEFFKLEGKHALPATSLRGVIRSVFEAITNSCMIFLAGQRLSKHVPANDSRKLWPARVVKQNGQWLLHIMAGTIPFSIHGPAPGQLLPAAWIMQYAYGALQSSPTMSYGSNKSTPYGQRTPIALPPQLGHKSECWALIEPMSRPSRTNRQGKTITGFDFWNVKQVAKSQIALPIPSPSEMVVKGWLCITNHNIENKHDERLFFSTTVIPPIQIPNKVRDDYNDLIQDYQDRHRDLVRKRKEAGLNPAKPLIRKDKKEAGFSRFILENHADLNDGDLVYVLLDGSDQNPTVRFIAPVSVPRVGYEKSIADLLEEQPQDLEACTPNISGAMPSLCPACRVFGWVHQSSNKAQEQQSPDKSLKQVAYAGRVKFSNGTLMHNAGTLPVTPLAILSSPKPTTTRFYLTPKDGSSAATWSGENAERGYDGNNVLRGRKFYRHHGVAREEEYRRAGDVCDDQNRTVKDALAPGAHFEFTIDFENLAPVELGALLWSLEMDGQGYHRLGFAKPLGFGSVKINISEVKVLDAKTRYASLAEDGWKKVTDWKKCVELFKQALANRFSQDDDFESLVNVRDLRALLGDPSNNLPVHYPRTARRPDPSGKNFEWFMGNNRYSHYALLPATEDEGLPLITRDGVEVK